MITNASRLTKLRSSTTRSRKQSHLPKGCLKDNRKQNLLHNLPSLVQNINMGHLFKVYEEFQDSGNSFKPRVGPYLAQGQRAYPGPTPMKLALTARRYVVTLYLWFSASYPKSKHSGLLLPRAVIMVDSFMALASTN